MKGVVARKGEEDAKAWTQREEDLSCCINPHLEGVEACRRKAKVKREGRAFREQDRKTEVRDVAEGTVGGLL